MHYGSFPDGKMDMRHEMTYEGYSLPVLAMNKPFNPLVLGRIRRILGQAKQALNASDFRMYFLWTLI